MYRTVNKRPALAKGSLTVKTEGMNRLHYVDNLRVFAFGLMIVFHTLKLFTVEGWGIHLTPTAWAKLAAEIISAWRLPVLFFVSGVAFSLSVKNANIFKRTAAKVVPVLVLATPLFVSAANYLADRYTNESASFWLQLTDYFVNAARGNLTWYHFWYLGYLLFFVALHQVLYSFTAAKFLADHNFLVFGLVFVMAISLLNEHFLRPHFPVKRNFFGDVSSVISFGCFYVAGIIATSTKGFLTKNGKAALKIAAVAGVALVVHFAVLEKPLPTTKTIAAWLVVFSLNGIFYRFLNVKTRAVSTINGKLLEIYAVHQIAVLGAVFATEQIQSVFARVFCILVLGCVGSYFAALARVRVTMGFITPYPDPQTSRPIRA
jgi:hypothetical protein